MTYCFEQNLCWMRLTFPGFPPLVGSPRLEWPWPKTISRLKAEISRKYSLNHVRETIKEVRNSNAECSLYYSRFSKNLSIFTISDFKPTITLLLLFIYSSYIYMSMSTLEVPITNWCRFSTKTLTEKVTFQRNPFPSILGVIFSSLIRNILLSIYNIVFYLNKCIIKIF